MIYLDIETIASDRAKEFNEKFWTHPGNVKKRETIDEKRKEALQESGLHWWTGQVVCICMIDGMTGEKFCGVNEDEPVLLRDAFDWITEGARQGDKIVGKNSNEFDLPFLVGRSMVHKIRIPANISRREMFEFRDVDDCFGGKWGNQKGKLQYYAFGLNLPLKKADGSEVQGMWDRGEKTQIAEYCQHDTELARQIVEIWKELTK